MNEVNEVVADRTRGNRGGRMVLGVITIVFGIIAIGSPLVTGAVVSTIIGMLLLVVGIFELIVAFTEDTWKAGIFDFISGAITILVAGLLIARPVVGSAVLTIILGIYFLIYGITRIGWAFRMRPASGWGWMIIGGLISIFLAILIFNNWPLSGIWAVGVLVGIRILFAGVGMLLTDAVVNAVDESAEQTKGSLNRTAAQAKEAVTKAAAQIKDGARQKTGEMKARLEKPKDESKK